MTVGQHRTSMPTLTDAQVAKLQLDASGNLKTVSLGSGPTSTQVQGNVASAAADSGNPVKIGGVVRTGAPPVFSNGQRSDANTDVVGNLVTHPTATMSTPDAGHTTVGYSYNRADYAQLGPLAVAPQVWDGSVLRAARGDATGAHVVNKGATTGGLAASRIVTGTTGVIKASAGQVFSLIAYNVNAAVRYLHLYNKATAPTLSTDTPIITIPLTAAGHRDINLTAIGAAFSTGIAWAYTTDDIAIPATAATSTELHATVLYA